MRLILILISFAAGLYLMPQFFFGLAYSPDGVSAQSVDVYGPEARAVAAVVAVLLGGYLVTRSGNTVGQLIGAACIGAALSLWLPIAEFIGHLTPPAA